MKIKILSLIVFLAVAISFNSCRKDDSAEIESDPVTTEQEIPLVTYNEGILIPNQYIVVLKNDVLPVSKSDLTFEMGNELIADVAQDIFNKNLSSAKGFYMHMLILYMVLPLQ